MQSALKNFNKNNFSIKIITVPGAFEIPVTISKNIHKFHGFVALGCVIKGETPHFDFISNATTNAIMTISVNSKKLLWINWNCHYSISSCIRNKVKMRCFSLNYAS